MLEFGFESILLLLHSSTTPWTNRRYTGGLRSSVAVRQQCSWFVSRGFASIGVDDVIEELIVRTDYRAVRTSDYIDVESAYQAVVKSIDDAQDWYLSRKASKRVASITLRVLALVAAVLGGLVPLANALYAQVDLAWGFLLLGIAAGFQVFDQLFGFSSAWGRYVPASLRLGMLAQQCRLEFAQLRAKNAEDAELLASLSRFASEAWAEMLGETGGWSTTHEESIRALRRQVAGGRREGGGA